MRESASLDHELCQTREESPYQLHQDHEVVQEKPPATNPLGPPTVSDEESHGVVVPSEEQHFPPRPPSPSPHTSAEDEKEGDLELGRASFTLPQANHDTPAEPIDSNVVYWDGPDDPANPVNWSAGLKWANVAVVSAITFITWVLPFRLTVRLLIRSLQPFGILDVRARCARGPGRVQLR